jgi:hypothetical protein
MFSHGLCKTLKFVYHNIDGNISFIVKFVTSHDTAVTLIFHTTASHVFEINHDQTNVLSITKCPVEGGGGVVVG